MSDGQGVSAPAPRDYWTELTTRQLIDGYLKPHAAKCDLEGLHVRALVIEEAARRLDEGGMTPERRALFLAGQHCQGGHSAAGDAIAEALGVPFPLRMPDLIAKLREEDHNPAAFYPWLIRAHGVVHGSERGRHPFFTDAELAAVRDAACVALEQG